MLELPRTAPPAPILQAIATAARLHNVPLRLLLGVAWVESRFNPQAGPSRAGAVGMMQLLPTTAIALGIKNPWDPAAAADGAARFLKRYHAAFGSWESALACYCWGPRHVKERPQPAQWPPAVTFYCQNVNRAGHAVPLPYGGNVWVLDTSAEKSQCRS